MYFILVESILNKYKEQPFVLAEEQKLCAALVADPEQSLPVQPLIFRINVLALQRDYNNIANVPGGIICSQKFLEVLNNAGANFSAMPALLRDQKTGQEVSSFYFGIIHRYQKIIDWEHSESWIDAESELGRHFMTKLVLTEDCEENALPLLRPEHTSLALVHDHLRTQIEQAKLIGIGFAPLDAIYSPHQGVRQLEIEHLLQKRPNHAKRWCELGDIRLSLYRFQEALVALDHALVLAPDLGKAWYLRGWALHHLGRQQEALEAYQKATEQKESLAWMRASMLLRQFGRAKEALVLIEKQRGGIWESGRPFWCELGETYAALGSDKEALVAFERALTLPGTGRDRAFCGKGTALFRLGRYEEALATYQAGLEAHSVDLEQQKRSLWRGQARVLRVLGRREEAAEAEQILQELEQEREFRMHIKPL
jgi:tetratricopeptide (TPR) repeat protein